MVVVFVHAFAAVETSPILRIDADGPAGRLHCMSEDFQLRRHRRARRVTLRVKPDASLLVTAPPRVPERVIREFIAERAQWIETARGRLQSAREQRPDHFNATHPDRLELPAIDRVLKIRYEEGDRLRWRARGPEVIELAGAESPDDARALLVDVLKTMARGSLEPRVRAFAERHALRPGRITWRNPNTRWGSCSSNGNLSLSVRLLLVSQPVADYVLLHELAHLEHPNHSRAFWAKVESMCPDYRLREGDLKAASRAMPVWIMG
jgi:predicted metal-dependent hydrolase